MSNLDFTIGCTVIFFSKKNRAPRALGEIYDKGAR